MKLAKTSVRRFKASFDNHIYSFFVPQRNYNKIFKEHSRRFARMVQFPGCTFATLWIQMAMTRLRTRRVTPFGHPGISGCVLLPPAFRGLPRPSSPLRAKASPFVRPSELEWKWRSCQVLGYFYGYYSSLKIPNVYH